MIRARTKAAATLGALAGLAWVGWGAYVKSKTDHVPYRTVRHVDDVEIRDYPDIAVARTTAPSRTAAFGKLFRYITGANRAEEEIEMTAPVSTRGEKIPMTAPVASEETDAGIEMTFYLPPNYTAEGAPRPLDESVTVDAEPGGLFAVLPFSWYATDGRVSTMRARLYGTLGDADIERDGETLLWQYDDPWTPPFMRRNEVAVRVDPETVETASPIPVDVSGR
jgi:hypothetical protein